MPIDDALLSALAGFLSSTSIQPQVCLQSHARMASDLSNQGKNWEENASYFDAATNSSVCFNTSDEMKLSKISTSGNVNYEYPFKEIGKESSGPVQSDKEENSGKAINVVDDAAKPTMRSINSQSHQMVPISENGKVNAETSSIPVPDECKASGEAQIASSFHDVEEEVTNVCSFQL